MNKVFNVGLIGCGHISETYFRAQKFFNNIKIIKCADINFKTAQDCAKKYNIKPSTFANAFVLTRPFLTSNIIGATTIDHLKENINSLNIKFTEEMARDVEDIHLSDPNPCV